MTLDEINQGINIESGKMECKARLNRNDIVGWLKTVAGFSNAEGGIFFIGVEDKTNKLIGFDRLDADNERNYFNNIINQHLTPLPNLKIDFIRYEIRGKERFIIKVEVFQAQLKPVILKYKGLPTIYMRRCGFTNGATYEEIINRSIAGKKVQYDLMLAGIKYEKEKFSTLFDYYKKENNQQLSDKMLSSMGFLTKTIF